MTDSVARSAVLVGAVTALARVVGFGRQLVFQATVGPTLLGTVYTTANYVPNIAFELVAGGALAGTVVPVVAAAAGRGDRAAVRATTGALLGWVLVLLVPVALLGALLARPVADLLLRGTGGTEGLDLATRMLLVFLPQIPLYGLAVVTAGVLQAHRRFLAAALAPVLSSVVVVGAYAAFAATFEGDRNDLSTLDRESELLLTLGTTSGVVALALTTLVPVLTGGYAGRLTLRFPPGVGATVRRLAAAGLAAVVAQQVALLLFIPLANGQGGSGALVSYQNAWMVYLLPYAVLALPIATSAFPRLTEQADRADAQGFAATSAASLRAVVRVSALGAAALAAAGPALGHFFALLAPESVDPAIMARAVVAFAPGLFGYALLAVTTRVLLARHDARATARIAVVGWATVAVAATVAAVTLPADWIPAALAGGHTIGMTVAGVLGVQAVRRGAGPAAVAGTAGLVLLGVTAAALGAGLGLLVSSAVPTSTLLATVAAGALAGGVAALPVVGGLAVWHRRSRVDA